MQNHKVKSRVDSNIICLLCYECITERHILILVQSQFSKNWQSRKEEKQKSRQYLHALLQGLHKSPQIQGPTSE